MELAKLFLAGVIGVAMVTAFGLHAKGLSQLGTSAGKAGSGLIKSAEGQ